LSFFSNILQIFNPKRVRLQPEEYYTVIITETFVRVEHPDRDPEQIAWNNINEIRLINTDYGPWAPDIWLALIGENQNCLIPHGSKGFADVINIISKYEGFNFDNLGKSMTCTDNEQFLLWK
jgi:hypothetical protein